jgi:hypothetical protein
MVQERTNEENMLFQELEYQRYIDNLEKMLYDGTDDYESTGVRKPSKEVFYNARKLISALCLIDANSVYSFCVTPEGLFQVLLAVYTQNKGTISVESKGFRCYNNLTQTMKYISSDYTVDQISGQLK